MRAWSRINSRISMKYLLVHDNIAATLRRRASRRRFLVLSVSKRINLFILSLGSLGHFPLKSLAASFALSLSLSFSFSPVNLVALSTLFTATYIQVRNININRILRELRSHFVLDVCSDYTWCQQPLKF